MRVDKREIKGSINHRQKTRFLPRHQPMGPKGHPPIPLRYPLGLALQPTRHRMTPFHPLRSCTKAFLRHLPSPVLLPLSSLASSPLNKPWRLACSNDRNTTQ